MTKVDIISGFLGAGKTTLIKKLIAEVFAGQQIVLIENEFGEIGIDGGFLKDAGINITEMNSGCICCSLVGDFATALKKVVDEYHPDRIIIEPSGVGKLSDVERAVLDVADEAGIEIATATTVVDAKKAKMYMKNFGEFFNNQVETARCVVLSRTQDVTADKLDETVKLIREKNHEAAVITTPWDDIEGSVIFGAMSDAKALEHELELEHEHHHHHHDDEDEIFKNQIIYPNRVFTKQELEDILSGIPEDIIRIKGYVHGDNTTLYFNYVLNEYNVYEGPIRTDALVSIIGTQIDHEYFKEMFNE